MRGPSSLRLGVAQPSARQGEPESLKVGDAVATIAAAGERGVELLLFPESYPGPIAAAGEHGPGAWFDAEGKVAEASEKAGVAVCWGRVEPQAGGAHVTVAYIHDRGERLLRYVRSHPATGDVHVVLSGAPMAPGPELGLAEVRDVPVGLAICSELWIPEVSRSLAISGAEILLAPAGGAFHRVAPNWRLIARARAVENLMHVGLTQAIFGAERGSALIAGPEELLGRREQPGLFWADLDLERARRLRATDDSMAEPKPFSSLPGSVRARRPELYGRLATEQANAYDYDHATAAEHDRPPRGD